MNKILSVYKPYGFTPLQMIAKLRLQFPEYEKEKIGYAGRLDPLANGVLLFMIGDATKERDKYLALPKSYEFTALFGVQTDTYDLLGLVKNAPSPFKGEGNKKIITTFLKNHLGKQTQTYPPYSSKPVYGKPLFWWAKEKKLNEITLPQREIEIMSFQTISFGEMTKDALEEKIKETIEMISGDFRQEEIQKAWNAFFEDSENYAERHFLTARFRVTCSSGTYVRGLVNDLGKELGTGAVTLDILRTKVGEYGIEDAMKLYRHSGDDRREDSRICMQ